MVFYLAEVRLVDERGKKNAVLAAFNSNDGDPGASKVLLRKTFPLGVASINLKLALDLYSAPTAGELLFASHLNNQKTN